MVGRVFFVGVLAVVATACRPSDAFECGTAEQCRRGTVIGFCESTGYCSFEDASCMSGHRYDEAADGNLGGACVGAPQPGDQDADAVADGDDNCPEAANTSQHDEDSDELGDACDPCPSFVDNSDLDADGVGDACDPNPQTPGDTIALFEGFGAGVPAAWTTLGTWTADADDVTASETDARIVPSLAATSSETLTASFTATGPDVTFDVGDPMSATGTGVACSCFTNAQYPFVLLLLDGVAADGRAQSFVENRAYEIAIKRQSTTFSCRFRDRGVAPDLVPGPTQSPVSRTGTQLMLRASGPVRVSWLMVVHSP